MRLQLAAKQGTGAASPFKPDQRPCQINDKQPKLKTIHTTVNNVESQIVAVGREFAIKNHGGLMWTLPLF